MFIYDEAAESGIRKRGRGQKVTVNALESPVSRPKATPKI
jgi:hypothetical protein